VNEDYWVENPLTIEQMTADGIELSEYLIKYLGKRKIIILGTSWGSVLGVKMALQRPDLFCGYIGHSQVVNASESLVQSYHQVYKMAQRVDDQESVDKLKSIGAPPYDEARNTGQLFRVIKKYEGGNSIPPPDSWFKLAPEYDNEIDIRHQYNGDDYSFINYVGHKKLGIKGMMFNIDFMEDGLNFETPVYLIQGENDILTPREITKKYFDNISAPKKEFVLVPGAAHGYNQAVVDAQYRILKRYLTF
jgi:pimeloyl-ACP methyl ester carboxylesterase